MKRQTVRLPAAALAAVWLAGCGSATLLFEDIRRLVTPPGSLDASFGGGDGIATAHVSSEDHAYALAVQSDGKIVVAGSCAPGDIAVMRFTSAGALDTSFGGGDGIVTTDLGGNDIARAVAIQADGKIVVAGSDNIGSPPSDIAVLRYTSNGTLDADFDGDGIALANVGSFDQANALAIQSDGMIVVAGSSDGDFVVLRYDDADGSLDPSFGAGGVARTNIGGAQDFGRAAVIQPLDQKIVAVGEYYSGSENVLVAVRYQTNGTLDTGFDGDGIALANIVGVVDEVARSVAIQVDGKIVLGGHSHTATRFAVVRLNADGSIDTSFGENGFAVTAYQNSSMGAAVALRPDGKILLAGTTFDGMDGTAAVACYLPDGTLDPSFGIRTFGNPTEDYDGAALALQSDGKILVAGYRYSAGDYDFALLRILP